jgi:Tfp pilus assembly protein PilP
VNRNRVIIFCAIGLLLALNLWRWIPADAPVAAVTSSASDTELQDLQLRVANVDIATQAMRRDLFYRVAPPVRTAVQNANPARRPAVPAVPVKSPEELALERSQAEFAAIRVIGIVFRNGRGQAYLETGGKSELVGVGDAFGSFKVTAIRQDSVELKGTETAAGGRIALAGS